MAMERRRGRMGSRLVPPLRRGLLTSPLRELWARRLVEQSWAERLAGRTARPSATSGLLVSLTSHAPRFGTLALTLRSLLLQRLRPEMLLLWIGHGDLAALPDEVLELEAHGLRIMACDDHGSHTKYVHALRAFPGRRIAICDDDTYYRPGWPADLEAADRPGEIACHRIHRVTFDARGLPQPYPLWEHDSRAEDASPRNFPTGVGGALLRRDRFDPLVLDMELARALCPTSDDLWLYWMAGLAGTRIRRAGHYEPLIVWRTSQEVALWRINVGAGANDRQMAAMIAHFGPESLFAGRPAEARVA
jgi:hypothetical protein